LCGRTVCVGALEEVPVAKILVADDNSNIQKMVVLALKDQGIEVVAVGNGEAAVRKIADIKPDLVLADIFMPVRNGYEVCKFVKDDSALSHIPVILLVGAFDPLDEQEAQRVGADGVLKKPFVPPDPLISMVKAALARAGIALGTPASTPPPPMPVAAKPQPPPVARIAPPAPASLQEPEDDLETAVFSVPRSSPLTIATSAQPLAFGSLLETATPEDEAVFAIPPKHTAPDRDWGSSAGTEEEEEPQESSKTGSWRISSAIEETASEPRLDRLTGAKLRFQESALDRRKMWDGRRRLKKIVWRLPRKRPRSWRASAMGCQRLRIRPFSRTGAKRLKRFFPPYRSR